MSQPDENSVEPFDSVEEFDAKWAAWEAQGRPTATLDDEGDA